MRIQLVHPVTGAHTRVGIGFSWPILALAFGLWLCATLLFLAIEGRGSGLRSAFTSGVMMAFAVYFAREFNGHRGRRLLMQGWRFAEPSAPTVRLALRGWQVPDLSQVVPATPAEAPSPAFSINADRFLAACAAPLPPPPQAQASAAPVFIPPSPSGGPMKLQLINPRTGELKAIKVGFSWTLFLFAGFFGIPLMLRKLYGWAALFLAISLLSPFAMDLASAETDREVFIAVTLSFGFQLAALLIIAIKGNELTAKRLIDKGWTFANPDSLETQLAKRKWGFV
ncbi:hypothetical protein [Aquabacter sediminis]|uniref:hypothetical protein n=1 Tax=Aquabacter sediminis TaxID=3029197 RepID=UPI00237D53EF|nr:hypothetical protein [Aquabacter sp. P-9]MDE1571182.1 hypothetical protein [Aquabacter sp. P-9]